MKRGALWFVVVAMVASAQVTPNVHLNVPGVDTPDWNIPTNANWAAIDLMLSGNTPVPGLSVQNLFTLPHGSNNPATCGSSQLFFNTSAQAGQNLLGCTGTNTWTILTGGANTPATTLPICGNNANNSTKACVPGTDYLNAPSQITMGAAVQGQANNTVLRDFKSAADFGAVGNYTSDDTSAIQATINAACAAGTNGTTQIILNNNRISGLLDFSACTTNHISLKVSIRNQISLGAPLVKPLGVSIDGSGQNGSQFQKGPVASITCDHDVTYLGHLGCLFITGSAAQDLNNITVYGSDGAQIYFLPGTQLVKMYNVGAVSRQNVSTSFPLLIDGTEWLECEHCGFSGLPGGAPYSIRITNSDAVLDFAGLIKFTDTVIAGPGIQMDSQVTAGNGAMGITLNNLVLEGPQSALLNIDATNEVMHGIDIINSSADDQLTTSLTSDIDSATTTIPVASSPWYVFPVPVNIGNEVMTCSSFTVTSSPAGNLTCSRGSQGAVASSHASGTSIISYFPVVHIIAHPEKVSNIAVRSPKMILRASVVDAPINGLEFSGDIGFAAAGPNKIRMNQRSYVAIGSGMVDADIASNGSVPLFSTPLKSLNVNTDTSTWTVSNGTITKNQPDPFGGTNAATLTAASCATGAFTSSPFSANLTINVGDWVIAGLWIKSESPYNEPTAEALGILSTGSTFDTTGTNQLPLTNQASLNAGGQEWIRVTAAGKVATIASPTGFNLFFNGNCGQPTTIAYPFITIAPAGTISDQQAIKYARYIGGYPPNLATPTGPRLSMYNETALGWGSDTYMTRSAAGEVSIPSVKSSYKSSDGTIGITGSTCTAWKNGLCVSP